MPTRWYNVIPDLPSPPPPPLHPGTHEPVGPDDLAPLFPMALIEQEVTTERWVDIPGGVLDVYRLWRPSPLYRAHRLERLLDTPAKIFYKYEGVSPAGSHKPNTAVPQAYYNQQEGIRKLTTETGRRPVGHGAGVRLGPVRHRVRDLAGRRVVPGQAVPPHDDGDLRGDAALQPVGDHRVRAVAAGREPGPQRQPRHRHLRGRGDGRRRPGDAVRAGQRAQPRAAAPDDHRRGDAAAAGQGRRDARRARRLHRRRLELRRPGVPVPAREAGRARWTRSSAASSRRPARA